MRTIAAIVGRSVATISRVLALQGLSSLKALEPALLVVRYEREVPGEPLHIDTKKIGRIVRPSHRVTGNRRDGVDGAERTAWLPAFLVYYNARRPHSALGYKPPASRLAGNNLLQLNN